MRTTDALLLLATLACATSCDERAPVSRAASAQSCDTTEARAVVERLGQRMKQVSLQADSSDANASAAADVIRRYYAAINARDLRRAYALWGGRGTVSKQTFEEFAAGFAHTARVQVEAGTPGRIEPAAGSRYIEVPVVIQAVTDSGATQRFAGTYVLRRSVVDGASPEERRWHIYSAKVGRAR